MRRALWLQSSDFPKEVLAEVEDLPFEGTKLFAKKMGASVHTPTDSWVTCRSLGIYILAKRGNTALSHNLNPVRHNICLNINCRGPTTSKEEIEIP